MSKDMETFAARLASFDLVLHPERRSSSAKSPKPITWPHRSPSPAELAHAGFYYNPYETNPDNTTCFLCQRALDGWEEEDNPITEHLKHARDCGWALMMDIQQHSSNPAEIEDPTSETIVQARQATFGSSWPHDGRRGWVCQSDKMVEGGWYFCPTEESNDLASCAYCKLSLDGWEPKDDPFHEHYRRSSDCSFFVFAQPPGKKTKGRSKKSRASKTSRLSTQSTGTATSETPMDLDEPVEQSTQTAKTKNKKATKSKGRNTRKRAESVDASSQMDVESVESAQPEPSGPTRATRGKKRSSHMMEQDMQGQGQGEETVEQPEPAPKRRATSRNSVSQRSQRGNDTAMEGQNAQEETVPEEKPKRGRRPTKKTAAKGRKASTTSTTSKTTSKSRAPRDSELDADSNAGLEAEAPGSGDQDLEQNEQKSEPGESKTDPTLTAANEMNEKEPSETNEAVVEPELPKKSKSKKGTGKRTAAKSKVEEDTELPDTQDSRPPTAVSEKEPEPKRHESMVSVEIKSQAPQQESDGEEKKAPAKKNQKKKGAATKGKKGKKPQVQQEPSDAGEPEGPERVEAPEPVNQESTEDTVMSEQKPQEETQRRASDLRSGRRSSSRAPPKTTERYSDIPHEKQLSKSLTESHGSGEPQGIAPAQRESPMQRPQPPQKTPSLSPQSSNAENRPPSSRPLASRPPVLSPSKKQVQMSKVAKTPSPSKPTSNIGHLKTSHPWIPVDIENILFAASSDKENVNMSNAKAELTSPEKKMTIEEWVFWNAKNGEDRLKRECERLVSHFEREGGRAMRALEGIECSD